MLYLIALLSGLVTVLSPCVLPILPVVIGVGASENRQRTRGLIIGLATTFAVLSLTLSQIIISTGISSHALRLLSAGILTLLGGVLLFPKLWDPVQARFELFVAPLQTRAQQSAQQDGFWGGVILGMFLSLLWTPCVGPILAATSTIAATDGLTLSAVLVSGVYSVGVATGLWLLTRLSRSASGKLSLLKRSQQRIRRAFGIIVMITGLLFITGAERRFQTWLLEVLPEQLSNPATFLEEDLGGLDFGEALERVE